MLTSPETNFAIYNSTRDGNSQPLHSVGLPRKKVGSPTYSLDDSDHGYILVFLGACEVMVSSGLAEGFGCGIIAWGTGDVSFVEDGVSIFNRLGFTQTAGQGAFMYLMMIDSDDFLLIGDGV
jgi:hypothetical protein